MSSPCTFVYDNHRLKFANMFGNNGRELAAQRERDAADMKDERIAFVDLESAFVKERQTF